MASLASSSSNNRNPPSAAAANSSNNNAAPTITAAAADDSAASEAGTESALAASSHAQRADLLAHQLKVTEAFRQSLESELRDVRYEKVALQNEVLGLQTRLEKSLGAQVHEIDKLQRLRKGVAAGGGGSGSADYEGLLEQLSEMQQQLADSEAARTGEGVQGGAALDCQMWERGRDCRG